MTRFSDRIGVTQPPSLAREGMPLELRTALWSLVHRIFFEDADLHDTWRNCALRSFYDLHHLPRHNVGSTRVQQQRNMIAWWFDEERSWWEFYNTIEHLGSQIVSRYRNFYAQCNVMLEAEGSKFRFVGTELSQITDENEIAAVNQALRATDRFGGAREHIAAALRLLGQRPEPDYRNSIRESITAVESTLKVLTGMEHAPMGDALRSFGRTHPIHASLFKGLDRLYGYTCNEHGIRHALIEAEANVGFSEAKFMVVAGAAFVSFLIAKGAT